MLAVRRGDMVSVSRQDSGASGLESKSDQEWPGATQSRLSNVLPVGPFEEMHLQDHDIPMDSGYFVRLNAAMGRPNEFNGLVLFHES
jgi:hypothetical protein